MGSKGGGGGGQTRGTVRGLMIELTTSFRMSISSRSRCGTTQQTPSPAPSNNLATLLAIASPPSPAGAPSTVSPPAFIALTVPRVAING